jgi:hypothetical protein
LRVLRYLVVEVCDHVQVRLGQDEVAAAADIDRSLQFVPREHPHDDAGPGEVGDYLGHLVWKIHINIYIYIYNIIYQ